MVDQDREGGWCFANGPSYDPSHLIDWLISIWPRGRHLTREGMRRGQCVQSRNWFSIAHWQVTSIRWCHSVGQLISSEFGPQVSALKAWGPSPPTSGIMIRPVQIYGSPPIPMHRQSSSEPGDQGRCVSKLTVIPAMLRIKLIQSARAASSASVYLGILYPACNTPVTPLINQSCACARTDTQTQQHTRNCTT